MAEHKISKEKLINFLEAALGKTLKEVDKENIFARTENNPKITGIAGTVIETSVLGFPADNEQKPDLIIDGVPTELKTTGIRIGKKQVGYEAKEPMSITAVSPNNIVGETFEDSKFWHKLEQMLLVYYHYDSDSTVPAIEYGRFPIRGYEFHQFSEEDKALLKNDWQLVRDFIKELQDTFTDPEKEYPRISSELRPQLMMIDTAPKWPNPPRFRLKRSVVSQIVKNHFKEKLEQLPVGIHSSKELLEVLHNASNKYKNKTLLELMNVFSIPVTVESKPKNIGEIVSVRMLGGAGGKLNKLALFNKLGIIGRTITLGKDGNKKEDTKLTPLNVGELADASIGFEDSELYEYIANNRQLFAVFQLVNKRNKNEVLSIETELSNIIFKGFKIVQFSESFIMTDVFQTWEEVRRLILTKELKSIVRRKKDGTIIMTPKTNIPSTYLNFPKSAENKCFVRGGGSDALGKTCNINGIDMYPQYFWIHGTYLVSELERLEYI